MWAFTGGRETGLKGTFAVFSPPFLFFLRKRYSELPWTDIANNFLQGPPAATALWLSFAMQNKNKVGGHFLTQIQNGSYKRTGVPGVFLFTTEQSKKNNTNKQSHNIFFPFFLNGEYVSQSIGVGWNDLSPLFWPQELLKIPCLTHTCAGSFGTDVTWLSTQESLCPQLPVAGRCYRGSGSRRSSYGDKWLYALQLFWARQQTGLGEVDERDPTRPVSPHQNPKRVRAGPAVSSHLTLPKFTQPQITKCKYSPLSCSTPPCQKTAKKFNLIPRYFKTPIFFK